MSKSKQQGTAWETAVVKRAKEGGLVAERLAEGGRNDRGDVLIVGYPYGASQRRPRAYVALAWKRLVQNGGKRRTTDGEPEVVVVTLNDFIELLRLARRDALVECKATERLNVTRVLAKARKKAYR